MTVIRLGLVVSNRKKCRCFFQLNNPHPLYYPPAATGHNRGVAFKTSSWVLSNWSSNTLPSTRAPFSLLLPNRWKKVSSSMLANQERHLSHSFLHFYSHTRLNAIEMKNKTHQFGLDLECCTLCLIHCKNCQVDSHNFDSNSIILPAHVNQFQQQIVQGMEAPLSSSTPPPPPPSSSSSVGGSHGGSSKPPQSFARRYKFLWPLLLTVNLAAGAYLFMRTKKKEVVAEEETTNAAAPSSSASTATSTAITISEISSSAVPVESIPEEQQHELFKWMLEEKRKIKTNDPEEKKRIDEEKAVLKQFIRAKSIPKI